MTPLLKPVYAFQAAVCKASSHVLALPSALGFLMFWTGMYIGTHGAFDPGLGIGNGILNASAWIIGIATCSVASRTSEMLDLHAKIDALHRRLDAPRDRYIVDAEALREAQAAEALLEHRTLAEMTHS